MHLDRYSRRVLSEEANPISLLFLKFAGDADMC